MPPASPLANEPSFDLPQDEKSVSERKIAKTKAMLFKSSLLSGHAGFVSQSFAVSIPDRTKCGLWSSVD
jgi:hypothetical protein